MANYLEIRNDNNSVIVGDDYPILQPIQNNLFEFRSFSASPVDSAANSFNYAPRLATVSLEPSASYGWESADTTFPVIRPYVVGSSSKSTAVCSIGRYNVNGVPHKRIWAFDDKPINVQEVLLTPSRGSVVTEQSALVAYGETGELVFDSALGTAQLIKSITVRPDMSNGDKTLYIGDFTGYSLDFNRIFFRVYSAIYKVKTEFTSNGIGYRAGTYAWNPYVYMDAEDKLWVGLKFYTSNGYGVYDSTPFNDTFSIQIFYLPTIRVLSFGA